MTVRIAALAAVLVVALPLAACSEDDEGKVLEGTGYELTVPKGWDDESAVGEDVEVGGLSPEVVLAGDREDGFATNVNILRSPGVELELDAQMRMERRLLEEGRIPGAEGDTETPPASNLTPVERITLDDEPARAHEFELSQGGRDLQLRQVITIRDDELYVITLTAVPDAFDEGVEAFESVIDSWRWR